jgi:hypothetical protein
VKAGCSSAKDRRVVECAQKRTEVAIPLPDLRALAAMSRRRQRASAVQFFEQSIDLRRSDFEFLKSVQLSDVG